MEIKVIDELADRPCPACGESQSGAMRTVNGYRYHYPDCVPEYARGGIVTIDLGHREDGGNRFLTLGPGGNGALTLNPYTETPPF